MGFRMKKPSIIQGTDGHRKAQEGFMHPPYKKPVGPVERPHVHGYRDVEPSSNRKVMKDGPKNQVHGVDTSKDPHWQPHQFRSPAKKKGPCWEGYEMVGMKKKGGRTVPNCVPNKSGKISKPSPTKNKTLKKVAKELKGAVKMHGKQAAAIEDHVQDMKASPAKVCKTGAEPGCGGNFKVNKKGTVVSRTAKKVSKGVGRTVKKGIKSITRGIKNVKSNIKKRKDRRYNKKNKGTTSYMNPRYMNSHTMTAAEEKDFFDN